MAGKKEGNRVKMGAQAGNARRGWRARMRKIVVRGGVLIVLLLVVGALVVTQTGVVGGLVIGAISRATGLACGAGSVRVTGSGLEIEGFEARSGVPGDAGRVVWAERIEARVDWWGLLGGSALEAVSSVRVVEPVLRISIGEDGGLNFDGIGGEGGGGGLGGVRSLPIVEIEDGLVEVGEHTASGVFASITDARVTGKFKEAAGEAGVVEINLRELPTAEGGDESGLVVISGRVVPSTGELAVEFDGMDVGSWAQRSAPSGVRSVWARIAPSGRIDAGSLGYDPVSGWSAALRLDGLSMNLPVEVEGTGLQAELLRIEEVTGELALSAAGLRCALVGAVEEIPCEVQLWTTGLSPEAPFRLSLVTPWVLVDSAGRPADFATPFARRVLERFAYPSGEFKADLVFTRSDPGGVTAALGKVELRGGRAAFEEFSYPMEHISGCIEIDTPERVVIDWLEGMGRPGDGWRAGELAAPGVTARGWIGPVGDEAAVELEVLAEGVPIDDVLEGALGEKRGGVIRTLLSKDARGLMVEEGLLRDPSRDGEIAAAIARAEEALRVARLPGGSDADEAALLDAIAGLEAQRALPAGELSGLGDFRIMISRPEGPDELVDYHTRVETLIHEASLVIDRFPYPLATEGLRFTVDENVVEILPTRVWGVDGAEGSLSGTLLVEGKEVEPDLTIDVDRIRVDDRLLHAVRQTQRRGASDGEGAEGSGESGGGRVDASALLRELGVSGDLSGQVLVKSSALGGPSGGFSVAVDVAGVSLRPVDPVTGRAGAVAVAERGRVLVDGDGVRLEDVLARVGDSAVAIDLAVVDGETTGTVETDSLPIGADLGPLVVVVMPRSRGLVETIEDVRRRYSPGGRFGGVLTLGGEAGVTGVVDRFEGLTLDVDGRRFSLDGLEGELVLTEGGLEARGIETGLRIDGRASGRAAIAGVVPWSGPTAEGRALEIALDGAAYRGTVLEVALREFSPALAGAFDGLALDATVDATAAYRRTGEDGAGMDVVGELRPSTISLELEGMAVEARTAGSRISLGGGEDGEEAIDLRLAFDDEEGPVEARVVGSWWLGDGGERGAGARVSVEGSGPALSRSAVAVLPGGVRGVFEALGVELPNGFAIEGGVIELDAGAGELSLRGDVRMSPMVAEVEGVGLSLDGVASVWARLPMGDGGSAGAPEFRVDLVCPTAGVDRLALDDLRARISSAEGGNAGVVLVPYFGAGAYGGRVTGYGKIEPEAAAGVGYEVHGTMGGVDLALLLNALGPSMDTLSPTGEKPAPKGTRGELDGSLSLEGNAGQGELRRGRGSLRVQVPYSVASGTTDIIRSSGIVDLVRLSALQLPITEPIEAAEATLFVLGDRVVLPSIEAYSESVAISGAGSATLPDLDLDLTFATHNLRGAPMLTSFFEAVRNEAAQIRLTGPIRSPSVKVETLSTARQVLESIFLGAPPRVAPERGRAAERGGIVEPR